ncbi:hypothetical protein C0Q70_06273 [Pomacea canaliculata]|uniref:NTR domain-containing protein n=1 Tax=Pomacea canaliculata TaxID=400727 RepID=A0A2T7PNL0_POMCA|nr:hypothetical protein C0Q70_06273 [Pomacea canaliculata]
MLLWMTVALSWMTVGLACRCLQPTDEGYCKNDIVFRGIAVAEYQEETEEPYPREIRIYTVMSRKSSGLNNVPTETGSETKRSKQKETTKNAVRPGDVERAKNKILRVR